MVKSNCVANSPVASEAERKCSGHTFRERGAGKGYRAAKSISLYSLLARALFDLFDEEIIADSSWIWYSPIRQKESTLQSTQGGQQIKTNKDGVRSLVD